MKLDRKARGQSAVKAAQDKKKETAIKRKDAKKNS